VNPCATHFLPRPARHERGEGGERVGERGYFWVHGPMHLTFILQGLGLSKGQNEP
jgi:hypothetical protein